MFNQRKTIPWLIALSLGIVVILSILNLNFGENIVYFYTPQEAKQKAKELSAEVVKVGGMVQVGSVKWNSEDVKLSFILSDMKGSEIEVHHPGSPPDLFKEGQGVVAEGKISADGGSMQARRLMVKHSEEYKKPDDHSSMNQALLEESIFKNENPNSDNP